MIVKTNDDVRVLRKGTCLSLSGRSELTYEFGLRDKIILFHIAGNTGSGHFSSAWIPLNDILDLLDKAKDPFSLSIFKTQYPGKSLNNLGFLGSVLKQEGLIICEKRQYLKKDTKAFLSELNKLIKTPTKKTPHRKSAKTEPEEQL